jgi:5-methylcytosine-specific restriction protein A
MQISTDALIEHATSVAALNGVDPGSLSGDEASDWLSALARVRTATEAVMATLARRLEELSTVDVGRDRYARAQGFAGAPTLVAQKGQMSTGEAGRLLSLGRAMADADAGLGENVLVVGGAGGSYDDSDVLFETMSRAVAAGVLACEKATMIRGLLETLTEPTVALEQSLVRVGIRLEPKELARRCDRELARDHEALRARDRRQKKQRRVAFFHDDDGMIGMRGRFDVTTGIPLVSAIDGEVRRQMIAEREFPEDQRRTEGQIRADVFAAIANHAMGCTDEASGTKTVMVVQVDQDALEAGVGAATCQSWSGPISLEALRLFAVDIAIMPAVMGGASLALDLGRANRCFTPAQRLAIALRDKGCAKCGVPVNWCDVHHIVFWSMGGESNIDNGVMLCVGCHHRLHEYGWEIAVVDGHVWFLPPVGAYLAREWIPAVATPHDASPPFSPRPVPASV